MSIIWMCKLHTEVYTEGTTGDQNVMQLNADPVLFVSTDYSYCYTKNDHHVCIYSFLCLMWHSEELLE